MSGGPRGLPIRAPARFTERGVDTFAVKATLEYRSPARPVEIQQTIAAYEITDPERG